MLVGIKYKDAILKIKFPHKITPTHSEEDQHSQKRNRKMGDIARVKLGSQGLEVIILHHHSSLF